MKWIDDDEEAARKYDETPATLRRPEINAKKTRVASSKPMKKRARTFGEPPSRGDSNSDHMHL